MKREERARQFLPFAALTGLDEELLQSENIKHYEETVAVGIEDEVDYGVDLNEILRRKGEII
ncbi:MAG: hypothetical protein MJ129_01365 [Clostridia bacterium]|nr:hypothetical protein [Clostridia bacterium]